MPSLNFHQCGGGDGFDLRDDEVRFFQGDDGAQGGGIGHGDDVAAVCDLHAGGVGVAIDADYFAAQPLQGNDDFLAEFAAAQQHDAHCGRRQRGTQTWAGWCGGG